MQAQEAITVRFAPGAETPALRVYRLPRKRDPHSPELWGSGSEVPADVGAPAFEVVEGSEYRYEWTGLSGADSVTTDPQELFEADDQTGRTGRLRPHLSTGTVDAALLTGDKTVVSFAFEVRSRKLNYKSEYRWMLRDVAKDMTELVMQRFAASRMGFEVDERRDALTLYEQFEFLRAALQSETLRHAFARIVVAPHVTWEVTSELVPASRGVKSTAASIRHLARGGGLRVPITHIPSLSSIPERVQSVRTAQTLDTIPNRFVVYALEHWQGLLWRLADALRRKSDSLVVLRARREVRDVLTYISEFLDAPMLRDVGRLNHFPSSNQVVQKREGYRDFYRIFIEVELAAMLTWQRPDTAYRAGQRDVAELYEFWAYMQIGGIVGELIGKPFLLAPLLKPSSDGLAINLRSGQESVLSGELMRAGRRMQVALHFNRTFDAKSPERPSWTRAMRPDITLSITPADALVPDPEPTHIHFDAKYRVQALDEIFGASAEERDGGAAVPPETLTTSTVKRDDLLKMHAYRDAIRRTAGAYVLYPGSAGESKEFREFHELLPGLGAFVLRPTEDGVASGAHGVRTFIDRVLDQAALRFTQHERSTTWLKEVYGPEHSSPMYTEPPAQASVLLGYVKSEEHWRWVRRTKTYNVRAQPRSGGVTRDAALLQSQLLLLYCPESGRLELLRIVGEVEAVPAEAMAKTGYPEPQGDYWCVQVSFLRHGEWLAGLSAEAVDKHVLNTAELRGAPTLVTWSTVCSLRQKGGEA